MQISSPPNKFNCAPPPPSPLPLSPHLSVSFFPILMNVYVVYVKRDQLQNILIWHVPFSKDVRFKTISTKCSPRNDRYKKCSQQNKLLKNVCYKTIFLHIVISKYIKSPLQNYHPSKCKTVSQKKVIYNVLYKMFF